eukprot:m.62579 g.62579  ORF g.62579 m.62579 type:complete len:1060 (+) comp11408_c0_seq5:481-3660(+)
MSDQGSETSDRRALMSNNGKSDSMASRGSIFSEMKDVMFDDDASNDDNLANNGDMDGRTSIAPSVSSKISRSNAGKRSRPSSKSSRLGKPPSRAAPPPTNSESDSMSVRTTRTEYITEDAIVKQREVEKKKMVEEEAKARDIGYISNLVTGVNVASIKAGLPFGKGNMAYSPNSKTGTRSTFHPPSNDNTLNSRTTDAVRVPSRQPTPVQQQMLADRARSRNTHDTNAPSVASLISQSPPQHQATARQKSPGLSLTSIPEDNLSVASSKLARQQLNETPVFYDNVFQKNGQNPPPPAQSNTRSINEIGNVRVKQTGTGRTSKMSQKTQDSNVYSLAAGSIGKERMKDSKKPRNKREQRPRLNTYARNIKKASTDGYVVVPDVHTLRSNVTTVYSRHEDFYPEVDKSYYVPDKRKHRRMCSVIPCYNEESDALKRTLSTLYIQLPELAKLDFDFHAVIIMDGWQLVSDSMRSYLQTIFDMPENVENDAPTWWDDLNTLEGNPSVETFVIQNVNTKTWTVEPVFFEPEELPMARMHLTLIVKRDNRRKHNTLEWFFNSFSIEYGSEYSFTTDCGTLFDEYTIYHLARHLDMFPRCGGVTGRQRVMSAKQQGLDHESWYRAWMRAVQGFEYEATYASYVGAFSMAGMLPVIPGPCGLFNMKHLNGDGVQFFFDKVKQDPDTAGLLLGNGLLAEDRFLSYAAVVSTNKPTITEFVPESVFYFEAETELRTFVFQRRRWNNGTFACFIWLMFNLGMIKRSTHNMLFKLLMQFLIVWQVIWLCCSLLAPALFIVLLRLAFRHTFPANEEGGGSFWADIVSFMYIALYLTFIAKHSVSKFEGWLFHVYTLVHGVAVTFVLVTFIHAAVTKRDEVVDLTLYVFGVYQGAPIVLSLIVSPRSAYWLVLYFIPYMIFLPTHTMTFWTYALTRTFDLTWGNRPTTHKVPKFERSRIVDTLRGGSMAIIAVVASVNVLVALFLLQVAIEGHTLAIIWVLVSMMVFSGVQMMLSFGFAFEYHIIRRFLRWWRTRKINRRKQQAKKKRRRNPQSQLEWDSTGFNHKTKKSAIH